MWHIIAKPRGRSTHFLGAQVIQIPPEPQAHLMQDQQDFWQKGLFTVVWGIVESLSHVEASEAKGHLLQLSHLHLHPYPISI